MSGGKLRSIASIASGTLSIWASKDLLAESGPRVLTTEDCITLSKLLPSCEPRLYEARTEFT